MANKQPTVKQLQSTATRLLKGIDNSSAAIRSHQDKIGSMVPELRQTLTALSNTTVKPEVKAAAKVDKAAAKTAKTTPEKKEKPAKKVPVKKDKPAKKDKPKPAKKAASVESTDVVVSSHTAKDEVNEFVNKVASDQSVAQAL